jgi:hypothetical protein
MHHPHFGPVELILLEPGCNSVMGGISIAYDQFHLPVELELLEEIQHHLRKNEANPPVPFPGVCLGTCLCWC